MGIVSCNNNKQVSKNERAGHQDTIVQTYLNPDVRFTHIQSLTRQKNTTGFRTVLHLAEIGLHRNDLSIKIASIKLNSMYFRIPEPKLVSREKTLYYSEVYKVRYSIT